MNSPQQSADDTHGSRVSKEALVLMLIVIGALLFLAVFANVQRFRRAKVETVVVRTATSPTPVPQ